MITYNPKLGDTIKTAAQGMVSLANDIKQTVTARFEGRSLRAEPGDDPDAIIASYWRRPSRTGPAGRSVLKSVRRR